MRIHVIARNGNLTDLPLWASKRGQAFPDQNPDDDYVETRVWDEMRGVFRSCSGPILDVAIGEETVTRFPSTPSTSDYESPANADLGRILVHEIGHAMRCGLTQPQQTSLTVLYDAAFERRPTDVVGADPNYTVSTDREYFAEATAAWFEAGQHGTYRRAWLNAHDDGLYDLVDALYATPPTRRYCDGEPATRVIPPGGGTVTELYPGGHDVVVGSSSRDVIDVGTGNDLVCAGDGNDDLDGGPGDDYLYGEAGSDDVYGSTGSDHPFGGDGDDFLYGEAGNDILNESFSSGNDSLYGGPGNDTSSGGDGIDYVSDYKGTDELVGGAQTDLVDARDGDGTRDHVYGDLNSNDIAPDLCAHDPTDLAVAC